MGPLSGREGRRKEGGGGGEVGREGEREVQLHNTDHD